MLSAPYMFRYGDTWAPWRTCSNLVGQREELLEIGINERISRLSGCSMDNDGDTPSLEASTRAERTWGPYGSHEPHGDFITLRPSPDADNLRLRFISGDETDGKYILRWLYSFMHSCK